MYKVYGRCDWKKKTVRRWLIGNTDAKCLYLGMGITTGIILQKALEEHTTHNIIIIEVREFYKL